MRKRKNMLAMLLTAAMAVSLAGCQSTGDSGKSKTKEKTESADGEIIIDFRPCLVSSASIGVLERAIEKFTEENPEIKVNLSIEREYTAYKLAFDSGTGPDICYVDDGNQFLLQKNGFLMDISEAVEEYGWQDRSVEGAIEYNNRRTPGQYYGIPNLMAPVVMFYNKDIFEACQVTVPKTWEEFETCLAKIKEAGYIPFESAGDNALWLVSDMVMNDTSMDHVRDWYYLEETTEDADRAFQAGFKKLDSWLQAGYFRDNLASVDVNTITSLFGSGETAILMSGDWSLEVIENLGMNVGVFAMPSINNKGAHVLVNAPDGCYALNAKMDEAKKAACLKLLDTLLDPEVASWYYEAGLTPTVKIDYEQFETTELKKEEMKVVEGTEMGYFLDCAVPGLYDSLTRTLQSMFIGEYDGQQAWTTITEDYEKLKNEQ